MLPYDNAYKKKRERERETNKRPTYPKHQFKDQNLCQVEPFCPALGSIPCMVLIPNQNCSICSYDVCFSLFYRSMSLLAIYFIYSSLKLFNCTMHFPLGLHVGDDMILR